MYIVLSRALLKTSLLMQSTLKFIKSLNLKHASSRTLHNLKQSVSNASGIVSNVSRVVSSESRVGSNALCAVLN